LLAILVPVYLSGTAIYKYAEEFLSIFLFVAAAGRITGSTGFLTGSKPGIKKQGEGKHSYRLVS
jgi:hypothetical protein